MLEVDMSGKGYEELTYSTGINPNPVYREMSIRALGMSLGIFLSITYILCISFDLLFPKFAMYPVWIKLLPGFKWLSWQSFFLGLIETFVYGWYAAVIFVPLHNFFQRKR